MNDLHFFQIEKRNIVKGEKKIHESPYKKVLELQLKPGRIKIEKQSYSKAAQAPCLSNKS